MHPKQTDVAHGVALAFGEWLMPRDVTTPECVVEGVEKAFKGWLDTHLDVDQVSNAIAEAVARRTKLPTIDEPEHERWFHRAPCCGPCHDCGSDEGCLVYNDDIHPEIHTCAAGCQCPPECSIHHQEKP